MILLKGFLSPIQSREGSLLVFTLWVLVLLSLFTAAVGYQVRQRLRFLQTIEHRSLLRNAVDSGLQRSLQRGYVALDNEKKEPDEHALKEQDDESVYKEIPVGAAYFNVRYRGIDGRWIYGLRDEESKLNINTLTQLRPLEQLIHAATLLDSNESSNIAAAIMDWKDSDDILNAGGAETRYYRQQQPPYAAKNKPFETLEEMLLLKGMTVEIFQKLKRHISLNADEKININTATEPVLLARGMGENLIGRIMAYRQGKDRILNTRDDLIFTDKSSIVSNLEAFSGLGKQEKQSLEDFIAAETFDVVSTHYTARIEGHIKHRHESLEKECVIGNDGSVIRCRENFYRSPEKA